MMDLQSEYAPTKTVKLLLSQISNAFQKQNEQKLTSLLKQLYNDPAYNSNAQRWKISINFNDYSQTALSSLFGKLLDNIRLYQSQKLKKGIHFAFKLHLDVLSILLKILDQIKNDNDLWLCKPLRQVLRSTKKIFLTASKKDQESGGAVSVRKDDLIIKLQQFRTRKTLQQQVKKQILPLIDNMQVSIMLVYHSYDQIQRILKNTKSYGEPGPAFIDNHLFQKGKTAMIYEKFLDAQKYFQQISLRTKNQKRLVLKYLIPCKMFLGKNFVPNPNNSQEHFPQYQLIIKALNIAKFSEYSDAIKRYQKLWIKRGIYLLMDKLRIILWRNLLKKVYKILGDCKMDMNKIHTAVKLSGGDQSLSECVCVISNLIYQGKLKGYIFQNQQQKVLVLKKDGQGFPSLSK